MSDIIPAVPIHSELSAEQVLELYDRWQAFVERVKEIDAAAEESVIEWIKANGPLDSGRMVYWLGHRKDTKCVNLPLAVSVLMERSGGDIEAFCRDFLASKPLKHGAARQAMEAELFGRCFVTETIDKLESGEALPKKLQKSDKAFLK